MIHLYPAGSIQRPAAGECAMLRKSMLLLPLLLIAATGADHAPRYDKAGALIVPTDYREWVFLSSGLNMNYGIGGHTGDDNFDNVFVDPASWRVFKATGHWPEGTIFAKEGRLGVTTGSINHSGQFQSGDNTYLELHVRDKRFPGGWGFFEADADKPAGVLPTTASCYACHQQHAASETTFVQFYPTAKPIAVKAHNFDASR
ncbi:MAG: cytochrome P460 family protein [Sphingomonas bacterium]